MMFKPTIKVILDAGNGIDTVVVAKELDASFIRESLEPIDYCDDAILQFLATPVDKEFSIKRKREQLWKF